MSSDLEPLDAVRLDIWLDVACLFKTRSEAQKACKLGKVLVNGQAAKANRLIRKGDRVEVSRPMGQKQPLVVRGLTDRHVAKAEARSLYEDRSPTPTPEQIEMRRLERLFHAATTPRRSPEKRERRALRQLKGKS